MRGWAKYGLISLMVVALLATGAAGCKKPQESFISVATGGTAGVYYPLGGAMAEIFNEHVKGVTANAVSTGASVANCRSIQAGEYQLALVQNDISYYATTGTEMFKDDKLDKLVGIATLYPEVIQIVTLEGRGIASVKDLRGKKVAVGAPGSGTEANARQILAAYGLSYNDLAKADYLSFAEAAANLKDGHIDAAFVTAGIPTAAIQEVAATHAMRLVPVTGLEVGQLRQQYPFYAEVVVPANTYATVTANVSTVAVKAMLITSTDMDEKMIYDLTKAMFENLDRLAGAHARGKDISLDKAREGMSLALHPGADKYLKEKGK